MGILMIPMVGIGGFGIVNAVWTDGSRRAMVERTTHVTKNVGCRLGYAAASIATEGRVD